MSMLFHAVFHEDLSVKAEKVNCCTKTGLLQHSRYYFKRTFLRAIVAICLLLLKITFISDKYRIVLNIKTSFVWLYLIRPNYFIELTFTKVSYF